MAKLYLFTASSGLYSCPLAMTDGAAKSIEVLLIYSVFMAYMHIMISEEITIDRNCNVDTV